MSLCSWKTLSNRVKFCALGLFRTAMRRAKARRGITGVAMQCSSWNTYQMMRNILATAIQVFAMNMRGILWWHSSSTSGAWSLWIIVFITLSLGSLWRGGRRQKEAEHGMISFPPAGGERDKMLSHWSMAKNGKAVLLNNFSLPSYDATHDEENWGKSISNYVFMSSLQTAYADSTYRRIFTNPGT